MNVYETCPVFQNGKYIIRFIKDGDLYDLFKVYSDMKSVPLFNSDNCHGDDFHYASIERIGKR